MKIVFLLVMAISCYSSADVDFGIGTSSFTYGRPIPSVYLGMSSPSWNFSYQSEGVQTKIYAQNAWTLAGYKTIQAESFGFDGELGAGFGASYILRSYRQSVSAESEQISEYVVGPYLSAKYKLGVFFLGFNVLLGLTTKVQDHILLNFQDMAHFTFGLSI